MIAQLHTSPFTIAAWFHHPGLIGSSCYRKPAEGQASAQVKPPLSNYDEVPEVNTRLTKLHIPYPRIQYTHRHLHAQSFKTPGFCKYKWDERGVSLP